MVTFGTNVTYALDFPIPFDLEIKVTTNFN